MALRGFVAHSLLSGLAIQMILFAQPASVYAEKEDFTIVPGKRIGVVTLGMLPEEVKREMGNHDGAYSLPNGFNVEYSVWKENDKLTYTMKMFYDMRRRVIQVSEYAPKAVTTNGISIASSYADVTSKYKNLKPSNYTSKDGHIVYYDDVKHGIAFKFGWSDGEGEPAKHLQSILIHAPDQQVMPDSDENPA